MFRRPLSLGVLLALVLSAPAAGHGRSALFPTVTAAAGHDRQARHVERRVRAIETDLLGAGHAAEHARQRILALKDLRSGANAVRRDADNSLPPQTGGVWAPAVDLPIVAINSVLLRTGKVLYFAYPYRPNVKAPDGTTEVTPAWSTADDQADAYVFDPRTGTSKQVTPPVNPDTGRPAQIFCAGASTLPDGRVMVAGGDVGDPTKVKNEGLNTIYVFDPATETWQEQVRMQQGRWYPTQLELPDGRTMIMSGAPRTGDPDDSYRIVTRIELFSPNGTLQRLENFQLKLQDDLTVPGAEPGKTYAPIPGQYPHLFWLPSGHALVAGPRKQDTWRFFPPAAGADDARWEDVPDLPAWRDWAAAVLLPGTSRVMLFGGADRNDHVASDARNPGNYPSMATTTAFDDANPAGGWTTGPAMHTARAFANAVQLPDGKVAVIGGGRGELPTQYYRWSFTDAQRAVDLYDPLTDAFTKGNSQAEGRTYHSTAVLLPDARVLSAGDDINGPGGPGTGARTDTAEIWSPPYLFDADGVEAKRPSITSAPDEVSYGQSFAVGSSDDIARAVLVAPGASTHDTDMSQRVVPLNAPDRTASGVSLTAPASGDLAPPGYYMLFLLDADGTPSKATFIHVGPAPDPAVETPSAQPSPTATATATPGPTATPTPSPVPRLKLAVTAAKPRLRALRRSGRLKVTVKASRDASVRLLLTLGGHRLATPQSRRHAAGVARVTALRLTAKGRRRLKGKRRATVDVRVTGVPAIGDARTVTRTLKLRR